MSRTALLAALLRPVLQDSRSFRSPHDRRISRDPAAGPVAAMAVGHGESRRSALAPGTICQMPKGAEVALIDVQDDPRFDLAHICRPERVGLGAKNGLWGPIRPPMRSKRQGSSSTGAASGASRPVLPSTHRPILAGDYCLHCSRRALSGGAPGDPFPKCPDAPRSDGGGKGVESGAPGRLKPTRIAPGKRTMHRIRYGAPAREGDDDLGHCPSLPARRRREAGGNPNGATRWIG